MKKFNFFFLTVKKNKSLFFFSLGFFVTMLSIGTSAIKAQPSATFDRMWVDYNVKEGNLSGMKIHVKFTANSLKATDCQLRVKFYYDEEKPLKDNNKKFYTTNGDIIVYKDLKPGFDPAEFSDFQLFMPYDELDLSFGEYKLKMDVDLTYKDGELIQHLTWFDFTYSKKAPVTSTKPTATFDKMWIEYDVTEKGQFGMRIHTKFTVKGMKETNGYLVFFFDRGTTETRLKSYDNKFQSKANDVAVYRTIKPAYDPAEFSDLDAFIPYGELHLTKGEHNLRIDAALIYENGTFIQHLGFEPFRYWKQ